MDSDFMMMLGWSLSMIVCYLVVVGYLYNNQPNDGHDCSLIAPKTGSCLFTPSMVTTWLPLNGSGSGEEPSATATQPPTSLSHHKPWWMMSLPSFSHHETYSSTTNIIGYPTIIDWPSLIKSWNIDECFCWLKVVIHASIIAAFSTLLRSNSASASTRAAWQQRAAKRLLHVSVPAVIWPYLNTVNIREYWHVLRPASWSSWISLSTCSHPSIIQLASMLSLTWSTISSHWWLAMMVVWHRRTFIAITWLAIADCDWANHHGLRFSLGKDCKPL